MEKGQVTAARWNTSVKALATICHSGRRTTSSNLKTQLAFSTSAQNLAQLPKQKKRLTQSSLTLKRSPNLDLNEKKLIN